VKAGAGRDGTVSLSVAEFWARARELDGRTLHTLIRNRPFTCRVHPDYLEFTPASSGKARRHYREDAARVLERFGECRAFDPVRYAEVTRNASYVLTVLHTVLESKQE
jgi:hypothetical protein